MRSAEWKLAYEKLPLITIQWTKGHLQGALFKPIAVLHLKVVHATGFGREMSGRTLAIPPQYHYGLPAGAKMMVPWVQGNVEIRIPLGCSHPFAINSDPGGWFWSRAEARIVLDKVDQRFRRLRLRNLLSRVGLYLELDFRTAASRRNTHRVILRSHRCRNKNNRVQLRTPSIVLITLATP